MIRDSRLKIQDSGSKNSSKTYNEYKASEIEKKWQEKWEEEKIYQPDLDQAKNPSTGSGSKGPFYNLMMFPYPSAEGLHVGSFFTYGGIDAYGRFKRMQGYDVFEPIGLDGFGIHSENYAIKVGRTPQEHAKISEENFYRQLKSLGNGFDWSRKLETYDPNYYKWTQWLFIELFKAGLAYKDKATVNFCPSCKTVLSDEQVIQKGTKVQRYKGAEKVEEEISVGVCERCESVVEKRDLEQWFFKITDYAERLLSNTEKLDWTEKVKLSQKNWIGKKTGALIRFKIQDSGSKNEQKEIEVFTTRPDTLFGATFLVISPEHKLVNQISNIKYQISNEKIAEIKEYVKEASNKAVQDRIAEGREKTGVFSGAYAINPVNNEEIPIWIADYVLTDYGTGAIMAVPAHDERDYQFAKKYNLPIKQVIAPETGIKRENETVVYGGCGVIFDPNTQKYAVSKHPDGLVRLYAGGVNEGEDLEKGILREVEEESGLYDFSHREKIQTVFTHFYNKRKKLNRAGWATCYLFILNSIKTVNRKLEPHELELSLEWMDAESILSNWQINNKEKDVEHWIMFLKQAVGRSIELGFDKTSSPEAFKTSAYTGDGIIINSEEWENWRAPQSIDKVTSWLEEREIGKKSVNYHLRDWLISRQRYWGPPIPMIYCESCAGEGKSWFTQQVQGARFKVQDSNWKADGWPARHASQLAGVAGWYPVPQDQLPVLLPVVEDFKPLGTHSAGSGQAGNAPLARHPEFYETTCPGCGGKAKRETDVSDTFLDSSWYFFRYIGTEFNDMPFPASTFRDSEYSENSVSQKKSENQKIRKSELSDSLKFRPSESSEFSEKLNRTAKWLPVTSYIGGAEHAVLHLLYSRFITMVLKDLGYIEIEEPYARFRANGLIIKDGAKMSKSKGNVINPDDYVKKFGADTLRTYLGFVGPFIQGGDFQDSGIEGINRFLKRIWTLVYKYIKNTESTDSVVSRTVSLDSASLAMMHKAIKGVTEDMEELRFNTAIAKIMTYYNFLSDQKEVSKEEIEVLLKLLAPFAPHMTEELYQRHVIASEAKQSQEANETASSPKAPRSDKFRSIHQAKWPYYDIYKIVSDTVVIAVQVNGKLRHTLEIQDSKSKIQEDVEKLAKESENVKRHLEGREIRKVIYVPGKILNFVV